jgi:transmembrane sensor
MERKTADAIDAEAAEWVARVERQALTADEEMAFKTWIDEDPRHLGAYGRLFAISMDVERAHGTGALFCQAAYGGRWGSYPASRRGILRHGAVAATLLVGSLATGISLFRRRSRYVTGTGEMKVVALRDGSVVSLNTQSELLVEFSESVRGVRLVRGEALFNVAKNASRPFLVSAGDTRVKVVGTSFTVRRLEANPVQVLVREGIVEVSKPDVSSWRSVRLAANTRAVALQDRTDIAAAPVAPAEVHRELAWEDGQLAFEGQSLGQAAAEFDRYSDMKIVIDDPALATEEIAGLFRATDPLGFAQTVALSLKAQVIIRENEVHLTR